MKTRSLSIAVCLVFMVPAGYANPVASFGQASYYHDKFDGRPTASGELYDKGALTAAHRSFAFGTRLLVTRPDTGQSVEVRVNDRGPHSPARVLDLSRGAAEQIDLLRAGVADVEIEVLSSGASYPEPSPPAPRPTPLPY